VRGKLFPSLSEIVLRSGVDENVPFLTLSQVTPYSLVLISTEGNIEGMNEPTESERKRDEGFGLERERARWDLNRQSYAPPLIQGNTAKF
jgi:hypothetical protein